MDSSCDGIGCRRRHCMIMELTSNHSYHHTSCELDSLTRWGVKHTDTCFCYSLLSTTPCRSFLEKYPYNSVQFGNRTSKIFILVNNTPTFDLCSISPTSSHCTSEQNIYIVTLKRQYWSWSIVRITLWIGPINCNCFFWVRGYNWTQKRRNVMLIMPNTNNFYIPW